MGFKKIEEGELYGINFHGKDYVVNPPIKRLKEAEKIFNDDKRRGDLNELLKAIELIIPGFPIEDVTIVEVNAIMKGITLALTESVKKLQSPKK